MKTSTIAERFQKFLSGLKLAKAETLLSKLNCEPTAANAAGELKALIVNG